MGALCLKLEDKELAVSPFLNSGFLLTPFPYPKGTPAPSASPCSPRVFFSRHREAWKEIIAEPPHS